MQKPVSASQKSNLTNNKFATLQGNDQKSKEANEQEIANCEIAKADDGKFDDQVFEEGEIGNGLDLRPSGPG